MAALTEQAERDYLSGLMRAQLTHEDFADPRVELLSWLHDEPIQRDPLRGALGV